MNFNSSYGCRDGISLRCHLSCSRPHEMHLTARRFHRYLLPCLGAQRAAAPGAARRMRASWCIRVRPGWRDPHTHWQTTTALAHR